MTTSDPATSSSAGAEHRRPAARVPCRRCGSTERPLVVRHPAATMLCCPRCGAARRAPVLRLVTGDREERPARPLRATG